MRQVLDDEDRDHVVRPTLGDLFEERRRLKCERADHEARRAVQHRNRKTEHAVGDQDLAHLAHTLRGQRALRLRLVAAVVGRVQHDAAEHHRHEAEALAIEAE